MSGPLLIAATVGLLLMLTLVLGQYLERLPEAPACPDCRAVTRSAAGNLAANLLFAGFLDTAVRECVRCGWKGRMRWRWEPERAGGP